MRIPAKFEHNRAPQWPVQGRQLLAYKQCAVRVTIICIFHFFKSRNLGRLCVCVTEKETECVCV